MESLIPIRYLFDTLQPDEQTEAIKRITVACGAQWIMTSIFNHLATKLQSDSTDQPMIAVISKQVSDLILDRKSKVQDHDIEAFLESESETDEQPLSIEDIPSVMISKIASYLTQNDYIQFMHSSRRILIGCHSPFAIYHLDVDHKNYKERGVRDKVSVRSLALHDILQSDVLETAGKYPNNSNIERLTVSQSAKSVPQNISVSQLDFLQFMKSFSNAKCFEILTPIPMRRDRSRWTDDDIPTMPALKGAVYHPTFLYSDPTNHPLSAIEYYWIRKHAKQIESLKFVSYYDIKVSSSNLPLSNLTELKLVDKSRKFSLNSICKWIGLSKKLRIISVDCSRVSIVPKLIPYLIGKQPDLQFVEFVFGGFDRAPLLLRKIQNGLFASKLKEKTKLNENMELKVRIRYERNWVVQKEGETGNAQNGHKLIDGLGHLAQILAGCNVRHFMVQAVMRSVDYWGTPIANDRLDRCSKEQNLDGLVMKWREQYRVDMYCESRGKSKAGEWCVVFCNKDNPMKGGYRAHGLFVE